MVRLSAQRTGRLYPQGNNSGTHFCWSVSQPQGQSAAERIMSMKNSNDTIGNRTRHLSACSAMSQTTAPQSAPFLKSVIPRIIFWKNTEINARQQVLNTENRNLKCRICC